MKIFVTGATGFIGSQLCHALAKKHKVIALYRDESFVSRIEDPWIEPSRGDVTQPQSLLRPIQDCDACVHLASIAKPWTRDKSLFQKVNVEGTRNVFEAALHAKLDRVVFVSTAGIFGSAPVEAPITEKSRLPKQHETEYERSKYRCEQLVLDYQQRGLDIVTVYPTRVFGPGVLSSSNALTWLMQKFISGYWRYLPGNGDDVGNYIFINDLIRGLELSLEKSHVNARYLLGGDNVSFREILETVQSVSGIRKRLIAVPRLLLWMFAYFESFKASLTGIPPRITPPFVRKYLRDGYIDSSHARRELGFETTPFDDAVRETIEWLAGQRNHQIDMERVTQHSTSRP